MPQAESSLSPLQKDALEKSYITLGILAIFLESAQGELLEPDSKLLAQVNRDSAAICRHRLLTAFPELHLLGGL